MGDSGASGPAESPDSEHIDVVTARDEDIPGRENLAEPHRSNVSPPLSPHGTDKEKSKDETRRKTAKKFKAPPFFLSAAGYKSLERENSFLQDGSAADFDDLEIGKRLEKLQPDSDNGPRTSEWTVGGFEPDNEPDGKEESATDGPDVASNVRNGSASFAESEEIGSTKQGLPSLDGIEQGGGEAPAKKRGGFVRRHRCALCCMGSCCVIFILVLGILALIGYLLFRPREPGIGLTNYKVHQLQPKVTPLPPRATLTFNISGTLTLDNPNYFSLGYRNTSAYVSYRNMSLATIPVAENHIPARSSRAVQLSAVGRDFNLISKIRDLTSDLSAQRVPLAVDTFIPGRFTVLGVFRRDFQALISCNFTMNPDSPSFKNVTLLSTSCKVRVTL